MHHWASTQIEDEQTNKKKTTTHKTKKDEHHGQHKQPKVNPGVREG